MNPFTKALWLVLMDDEELFQELTDLMRREHKPFLNEQQAFEANAAAVKHTLLERLNKWLDWLPTLPIDQIGCALAEEALGLIEWTLVAERLKAQVVTTPH